jgi:hypothetical protein
MRSRRERREQACFADFCFDITIKSYCFFFVFSVLVIRLDCSVTEAYYRQAFERKLRTSSDQEACEGSGFPKEASAASFGLHPGAVTCSHILDGKACAVFLSSVDVSVAPGVPVDLEVGVAPVPIIAHGMEGKEVEPSHCSCEVTAVAAVSPACIVINVVELDVSWSRQDLVQCQLGVKSDSRGLGI